MSSSESGNGIPGNGQANMLSLTTEDTSALLHEDYASRSGESNTQGVSAGTKKLTQTANDVRPLGH